MSPPHASRTIQKTRRLAASLGIGREAPVHYQVIATGVLVCSVCLDLPQRLILLSPVVYEAVGYAGDSHTVTYWPGIVKERRYRRVRSPVKRLGVPCTDTLIGVRLNAVYNTSS
jgi:hypothetical protein